jgi:hypothetical protein
MAISGFPDATTAGVPTGVALTPSGSLTINTPGAVIEGLDIQGMVTINADNVTLKNCKVTAGGWAVINITSGKTGVVIQDCEINGLSAQGVRGISGQGTFLRNDIHHTEDGIYLTGSNTLIQDNYIHDLQSNWSGPHYDGIATDGGVSNITIRHNTVINPHGQTSALMLSNYFGSVTNVTVDNNLLEGGGYTVYSDGQFNGGTISGVSFTNNYLVRGQYGYSSIRNNTPVWQGNVDGDTGQPVGGGSGAPTLGVPTIGAFSTDTGIAGDGITNDNTLTLTGSAVANSTVKVFDGATQIGTVTATGSGAWSFVTAILADGNHSFTATATSGSTTSPASAARSVRVDTVAPSAPTIVLFSSDTGTMGDGITGDNTLTLTGTAAASITVKVYDGGAMLGTVTANGSGAWSYTTGTLLDATHSFTATATDAAGNVSAASTALVVTVIAVTIDTGPPAPPVRGTGDYNGDGYSDILWRHDSGQVYFWEMNGLQIQREGGVAHASVPNDWHIQTSGDFDADGNSDVLWRHDSGQVYFWEMNGLQIKAEGAAAHAPVPNDWHIQGTGDFDADGKSDIVWRHDSGQVYIWEMNGLGTKAEGSPPHAPVPNDWHIQDLADFDGDGKSDILWRHDNGQVYIWEMNGLQLKAEGGVAHAPVPNDWHIQGTGDFDGDGKSDILWRHDSGQVYIWEMNGLNIKAEGTIAHASVLNDWHVQGTGDFNGDGKSDIVWRHDSGQVYFWEMNGLGIKAEGSVAHAAVPNDWHILA